MQQVGCKLKSRPNITWGYFERDSNSNKNTFYDTIFKTQNELKNLHNDLIIQV